MPRCVRAPVITIAEFPSEIPCLLDRFSVVRELMFGSQGMSGHDWSQWRMSVHDDGGNELFSFRLLDIEAE
jgi:hypothetical protein